MPRKFTPPGSVSISRPLQLARQRDRRHRHVVDALALAQLLVLQLLDVAERLHRRAVAVDVAAARVPTRASAGNSL
jgi:hypothetical protein